MKLLLAFMLSIPMMAQASLSYKHYMNIIKGEYKLVIVPKQSIIKDEINFKIDNKGNMILSDEELEGKTNTVFFNNPIGPIGLPTTTVMAYYYSDEQTEGYNMTLRAKEGEPSKTLVQGVIFSANDGPNKWTDFERVNKFKLLKKDEMGKFKEVERI